MVETRPTAESMHESGGTIAMMRTAMAVGIVLALAGSAFASASRTLSFDAAEVRLTQLEEYGQVELAGCTYQDVPGLPRLPGRPVFVALPDGHEAIGVRVVPADSVVVATDFVPVPTQEPAILPIPGKAVPLPAIREPDAQVYASADQYPRRLAGAVGTGRVAGVPVASTVVTPFRWSPQHKTLTFYPEIHIEVETKASADLPSAPGAVSPAAAAFRQRMMTSLGIEPGGSFVQVTQDAYDYLLVCARQCSTAFAELADWKTRKGLRSVIVTRELIEATYPGEDLAAQIRACIQDYYQNQGVWCVLLGGDTEDIPCRTAWAMDCQAGMSPDEDDIPADLYYADLDGTWDANGDGIYGQVNDGVDLYPDVLIGRLPANDPSQAADMVAKLVEYETSAPLDYQNRALFCAEVLWNNPFTDGGQAKDLIDDLYFPPSLDPVQKLYQTMGNESDVSVIAALNDGRCQINHNGHCWYTVMSCGNGMLEIGDMDGLTNASRYGLLYSIGCWPAAFDYNCIAEHFVQNPAGGGVAFIGNSRYGWGSPGNPCYGYSDIYDQQFWRNALADGGSTAGEALAAAKVFFIPYSQQENVYRIHQYEVNLLGEPDMPVWSDLPVEPVVDHPTELATGQTTCVVEVKADGAPCEAALVCLRQSNGLYIRGYTDASGTAELPLDLSSGEAVDLTVTGDNLKPYMTSLPVSVEGPFLEVSSHWFEETTAPFNGLPNPGEELYVGLTLCNAGDTASGPVSAVLTSPVAWVTVTDSALSVLTVGPGQSVACDRAYCINVDPSVGLGDGCALRVQMATAADTSTALIPLVVAMADLSPGAVSFEDNGGDGQFDPGETASFDIQVVNAGNDTAHAVQGTLQSLDQWLTVTQESSDYSWVAPGDDATGSPQFELALDSASPVPRTAAALLTLQDVRWTWQETLWVAVGGVGFQDDMELSNAGWACPGGNNHWHRSSWRSHSGSYSWYAGDETSHRYANGARDTLVSPNIVGGQDAELSFWARFDVTVYGTDGMYVEAMGPQGWTRLGYIGSGGALEGVLMGHDWAEYAYDLGWLSPGASTKVRFVFRSDGSQNAEGFCLDDVVVSPCTRVSMPAGDGDTPLPQPGVARLTNVFPNPASTGTAVSYSISGDREGGPRKVCLRVYDGLGRLVATPADYARGAGSHTILWNLRLQNGLSAPPGLYTLRLDAANPSASDTRRLVVIR
jgi:hypothetical protein